MHCCGIMCFRSLQQSSLQISLRSLSVLTSSFSAGFGSSQQIAAGPGPPASCSSPHTAGRSPPWAAHSVLHQLIPAEHQGSAWPSTQCGCGSRTHTRATPCRLAACTGCILVGAPSFCDGQSPLLLLQWLAQAPGYTQAGQGMTDPSDLYQPSPSACCISQMHPITIAKSVPKVVEPAKDANDSGCSDTIMLPTCWHNACQWFSTA